MGAVSIVIKGISEPDVMLVAKAVAGLLRFNNYQVSSPYVDSVVDSEIEPYRTPNHLESTPIYLNTELSSVPQPLHQNRCGICNAGEFTRDGLVHHYRNKHFDLKGVISLYTVINSVGNEFADLLISYLQKQLAENQSQNLRIKEEYENVCGELTRLKEISASIEATSGEISNNLVAVLEQSTELEGRLATVTSEYETQKLVLDIIKNALKLTEVNKDAGKPD